MFNNYKISTNDFFVEDKGSVSFHVKSADYFGTIATIISLWKENGQIPNNDFKMILEDLLDLQNNYEIKKKSQ